MKDELDELRLEVGRLRALTVHLLKMESVTATRIDVMLSLLVGMQVTNGDVPPHVHAAIDGMKQRMRDEWIKATKPLAAELGILDPTDEWWDLPSSGPKI